MLLIILYTVSFSQSSDALLDIDDPEFWKSISDSIPAQSQNLDLFRIVSQSLCGETLTLVFSIQDNQEWWQYQAKIGQEVKQYHIDRPGLIKKATDPVPTEFILGRWNSTECQLSQLPTIYHQRATEIFIYGRILRSIYYSNDAPIGWLDEWKVDINGEIVHILIKVSENLYILKNTPKKQGITRIFRFYNGRKRFNTDYSTAILDNFLLCFSCNFLTSVESGYQIVLDTEYGQEVRKISKVWDKILIELDDSPTSRVLKSENWTIIDKPNHEIYLRGAGTISWCGNLMFGKDTSFKALRSDEDLLISYSKYGQNKILSKPRSAMKFVSELYEIVKIHQIFSNDSLELTNAPANNQLEGDFIYYTQVERNESIHDPLPRTSYWNVECPPRISFNPVNSLHTYRSPCLDLESTGTGFISFSVTYPNLDNSITPIEITLTSHKDPFTLIIGTSNGYGIQLSYRNEVLYERVYSTRLLYDNLGYTSVYIIVYNSHLVVGLGQRLGSSIKLKLSHNNLSSITSFSFSSLHPVQIYDLQNLSIQSYMIPILEYLSQIPYPDKPVTFIEEIDQGDSCKSSSESRKTQVEYVCGENTNILEVDEVMPCRYRLVISSPFLCPIKFDFLPPMRNINFSMDKVIYMTKRRYKSKL